MSQVNPIPAGHEGIIPHLVVSGAAAAIEFYVKAFGAVDEHRAPAPGGGGGGEKLMHASIMLDGRPIYLCDDFPEWGKERSPSALGGCTTTIHRYVPDVDAAMKRAQDAGATVTMPAQETFWGDRYGMVTDPFGHHWSLATHTRDLTPEEMEEEARKMFGGCGEGGEGDEGGGCGCCSG